MGLGRPRHLVVVRMTDTVQHSLFGDPVTVATDDHAPAATQDPRDVARIVRSAQDPGFFVIERTGRVLRADPSRPGCADAIARHDGDTVAQLLDSGHLTLGGSHHIHHGGHEGPARSVLVPTATRDMVSRWDHLRPVPEQRQPKQAPKPVRMNSSGVIGVYVVEPGKALVVLASNGQGGTILRDGGRYRVENDHGTQIGHASSYRAAARIVARHHGFTPGPVEIEYEHRQYGR